MNNNLGPIFSNKEKYAPGIIEQYYINLNYYKKAQNKFFVELGAGNGIVQSNTKTLESKYGWSGLLIEGNDVLYNDLKTNRPNCVLRNEVVWKEDNQKVKFKEIKYRENVSNSEYLGNSKIITDEFTPFEVSKTTKTLKSILLEANAPKIIDFMVVDVEDSFYEVLQGMDFKNFQVNFICVEMKLDKSLIHTINFLISNNFKLIKCCNSGPDFYFINNDNR